MARDVKLAREAARDVAHDATSETHNQDHQTATTKLPRFSHGRDSLEGADLNEIFQILDEDTRQGLLRLVRVAASEHEALHEGGLEGPIMTHDEIEAYRPSAGPQTRKILEAPLSPVEFARHIIHQFDAMFDSLTHLRVAHQTVLLRLATKAEVARKKTQDAIEARATTASRDREIDDLREEIVALETQMQAQPFTENAYPATESANLPTREQVYLPQLGATTHQAYPIPTREDSAKLDAHSTTSDHQLALARSKNIRHPDKFRGDRTRWIAFEERVRGNLRKAEILYPAEEDKIEYVRDHLDGTAYDLLHSRTRIGAKTPLSSFDAVMTFLHDNYYPHDLLARSKAEFHNMTMHDSDKLEDFLAKFRRAAFHVGYDDDLQIEFLKDKAAPRLRRAMVGRWHFDSFQKAEQALRDIEQDQQTIYEQAKAYRQKNPSTTGIYAKPTRSTGTSKNDRNQTTHRPNDRTTNTSDPNSRIPLTAEERERLMKVGGCFYCREIGHVAPQCPTRPSRRSEVKNASIKKHKDSDSEDSDTETAVEGKGKAAPPV
jgi:hypothetical protein